MNQKLLLEVKGNRSQVLNNCLQATAVVVEFKETVAGEKL